MNKIKQFFTSDHVPRWQVLAVGLVAFGASAALNEVNYQRSARDAQVQVAQERVEAKLLEIERHSVEFQTYAGAFVSAILDETSEIQERREELIGNILAQDAAVDVSFTVFNDETRLVVTEYRAALREMRNAIDQVDGVVSMGLFWEAAADLLVARNELLQAIENQSNSPSM